jgi:hypothetical protein
MARAEASTALTAGQRSPLCPKLGLYETVFAGYCLVLG